MGVGALAATAAAVALAIVLGWALAQRHSLRARAAKALDDARAAEAQLGAILAVMAEAVVVQGADGSIVYVNEQATRVLDVVDPAHAIGRQGGLGLFERYELFDEHDEPVTVERLPGRRALAGETPEPMPIRVVDRRDGSERWVLVKSSASRDPRTGAPQLAVTVIEDVTAERRAAEAATYLAEASRLIGATTDFAGVVERVARAAVARMADWCVVDVTDEHDQPEQTTIASRVARTGVAPAAVRDAEAALRVAAGGVSELSDDRRTLVVALTAGRLAVGAITLVREEPSQPFRPPDVELIEDLGRRAGIAIESARVTRERAHVATTLQRSLLPPSLPDVPGLSIAARFRAAGEANQVGGDFYDVFEVDGSWMVVMGDVTGKGAEAAAITAVARYTVRTAAHYEHEPAEVLGRLNEALLRESGATRRLCTAVCLRVDGVSGGRCPRVLVASAGHPLPWLVAADGSLREVCSPGPLLGAFDSASWRSTDLRLDPGSALVLYTDGVTDTSGAQGRFGVERLRAVLRDAAGKDADAIAAAVDDALRRFQDGPQDDDVALLVLRAATTGNAPTLRGVPSQAP